MKLCAYKVGDVRLLILFLDVPELHHLQHPGAHVVAIETQDIKINTEIVRLCALRATLSIIVFTFTVVCL